MSVTSRDKVLISSLVAVLLLAAGAIAVAVFVTRGAGSDVPALTDPISTAPSTTADPDAAVRAEVLRAYDGYQRVLTAALAQGSADGIDLRQFVGDPLLRELVLTIEFYSVRGIVHEGQPGWNPTVTDLQGTAADRTATIEDCFDSTEWEAVYEATGESAAAPDQAQRFVITSTATYVPDRGWLITESRADRSSECE